MLRVVWLVTMLLLKEREGLVNGGGEAVTTSERQGLKGSWQVEVSPLESWEVTSVSGGLAGRL